MKLNSELKEIFNPLLKAIKNYLREKSIECDELIIYVKTPHIIYKKVVIYIEVNKELKDITTYIESDDTPFNISELKSIMAKAYMNYYTHYHQNFNDPYYCISISNRDGKLKITSLKGDKSPDPIDDEFTVIRK